MTFVVATAIILQLCSLHYNYTQKPEWGLERLGGGGGGPDRAGQEIKEKDPYAERDWLAEEDCGGEGKELLREAEWWEMKKERMTKHWSLQW